VDPVDRVGLADLGDPDRADRADLGDRDRADPADPDREVQADLAGRTDFGIGEPTRVRRGRGYFWLGSGTPSAA
jgi:hypothetical protein